MNDEQKRTHAGRFPHYLEIKSFCQCRDCLVPMLGILSYDARDFCIDCTNEQTEGLQRTLRRT